MQLCCHIFGHICQSSQVRGTWYEIINNESSMPARSCQYASTWNAYGRLFFYEGACPLHDLRPPLEAYHVRGQGKARSFICNVCDRVFMFLFEHRSTHDNIYQGTNQYRVPSTSYSCSSLLLLYVVLLPAATAHSRYPYSSLVYITALA